MNLKAVNSDLKPVPADVAQGLILGPLLFTIANLMIFLREMQMLVVCCMQVALKLC